MKISLEGFCAFKAPFELDLNGGKNLLMQGENGSGNSSISLAMKLFLGERGDDIDVHRNQFLTDTLSPNVRFSLQVADAGGAIQA